MAHYLNQAGLTRVWTNIKNYISNNIPSATASKIGGVKTGYTTTGKNYKVQLDSSSNAFVNVPWANTTYGVATTSANGLMSKDDKTKLDGFHSVMETNGSYILTEAGIPGAYYWNDTDNQMEFMANDVPGNWLSEDGWEYSNNNIFVLPNIPTATTTSGGVMSPKDKKTLDNSIKNIYTSASLSSAPDLIKFSTDVLKNGICFFGAKTCIKFYGLTNVTPPGMASSEKAFLQALYIDNATADVDGLMAKEDKSKLDGGVLTAVWDLRGKNASASAGWSGLDVTPLINEHRPLVLIMDNGNDVETVSVSYKTGSTIYLWYHASKTVDSKITYVLKEVHLWYESSNNKVSLAQFKEITG